MDILNQLTVDNQEGCLAPLSFSGVIGVVIASCVLGLIWAAYNVILVNRINVEKGNDG